MIKLLIFDFDGVLADLKEIHYESLNKALALVNPEFIITREEHVSTFDGLSTRKKLQLLVGLKGLPYDKIEKVFQDKQKFTMELLESHLEIDSRLVFILTLFKHEGYLLYVASNAIRETIEAGLKKLGIFNLFDKIYSNEDVANQKPHPQIYLKCIANAGVMPSETIIIEDSKHGRAAAISSGATVCGVDNPSDVTYNKIKDVIEAVKPPVIKWAGKGTTVLIPMAGSGLRFKEQGYALPKPLIDVKGKPMIQWVVENLNIDANFVFVLQREHYEKYNLKAYLNLLVPGCKIVLAGEERKGAAWDTLLAKEYINNDNHLLIANSDQFVEWDSCDFMYNMISNDCDGGILTFEANETKWSYAKVGEDNYVCEVAEKKVISPNATVGIYYWKLGSDYVKFSEQMISKDIKINNEFYVCPVFNEAIEDGKKIKIYPTTKMWGLGTPEDLSYFLLNYKE